MAFEIQSSISEKHISVNLGCIKIIAETVVNSVHSNK